MRDVFVMVVLIVLIVTVGNIIRAKVTGGRYRDGRSQPVGDDREHARLQGEVKALKDRIAVLERITVDKENSLERQIEELRDR